MAVVGSGTANNHLPCPLAHHPRSGDMVRRRLAAGLQHTCEVLQRCLDISTGEVAPDTGLLAAVTGETAERIGIDSGLYAALQPLYAAATAGGRTIQVCSWPPGWVAALRSNGQHQPLRLVQSLLLKPTVPCHTQLPSSLPSISSPPGGLPPPGLCSRACGCVPAAAPPATPAVAPARDDGTRDAQRRHDVR